METIELLIDSEQREKLESLCVKAGESKDNYLLMAQVLLNESIIRNTTTEFAPELYPDIIFPNWFNRVDCDDHRSQYDKEPLTNEQWKTLQEDIATNAYAGERTSEEFWEIFDEADDRLFDSENH